jgi:transcriptional regulator with XRE-family HTH domain
MSIVDWDPLSPVEQLPVHDVLGSGALPPAVSTNKSARPTPPVSKAQTVADDVDPELDDSPLPPLPKRPLHRLAEVREQQGVTLRNVARRLNKDIKTVRAEENCMADVTLTVLYDWQRVLDVPIADLLQDDNDPLSAAVKQRAQLVRLMKTAMAMQEQAGNGQMKRMVQNLIEQLLDIMPELKEVGAWHTVGQRRSTNDIGRCAEQTVPDDFHRRAMN